MPSLPLDSAAQRLRYRLDRAARRVYCDIGRFKAPSGYALNRAAPGSAGAPHPVDLVESLVYRLGIDVRRMWRDGPHVAITGTDRRGRTVSVFFRDAEMADASDWVARMLTDHPADRVLTNHPAELNFDGCQRFEAIEAVFAEPFGGW